MTRSRSGTGALSTTRGFLTAADLVTVPPCDDEAEDDVQFAEAGAEKSVGDGERREDGDESEEHETDAHDRNGGDRERAAADERRAVAEQPRGRHHIELMEAVERERQESAGNHRRGVADEEATCRA